MSPFDRGFMADILAWMIREEKGPVFAARVEHWHRHYYQSIAGRPKDARIAGNHALLAAAFEQRAAYLEDVWPEAARGAEEFAKVDVTRMVAASVGSAAEDQGSAVFLESLRALLNWVRLEATGGEGATGTIDAKNRGAVIGRVIAGGSSEGRDQDRVVEPSLAMALQAVQRSLRQQGKPMLQVSEKPLVAQLEAEGLLLDGDNRPIAAGRAGNRSRQVGIERSRVRVIRMKWADLLGPDDEAGGEVPDRE